MRSAIPATLAGVFGPACAALVLWMLLAPRSELVSIGEGRGVLFPESGTAGGSQLLVLLVLLGAAAVCTALVLWHRHPGLRRPAGLLALAGVPGLVCALAAVAATPLADALLSPPEDTPPGEVVALPPEVGPLFFGPAIYGETGPSWGLLPAGAGWFALGAMVALFVVALLAHFSPSPELGDSPEPDFSDSPEPDLGDAPGPDPEPEPEVTDAPEVTAAPEDAAPRTDR